MDTKNHPPFSPCHTGCTSSGIHGRWQEIPVVESPSFRDLAVSACHFFVWDTGKAEIKNPKWEALWAQSFKLGLSVVESWIIQMWIHCLLWCNFSFLKTNDMNILDGKMLIKLRDFCQPGILQLSWRSKMRSKWRPQWFATTKSTLKKVANSCSLPTPENNLWEFVCKPVSTYQLLFSKKKHLVGCHKWKVASFFKIISCLILFYSTISYCIVFYLTHSYRHVPSSPALPWPSRLQHVLSVRTNHNSIMKPICSTVARKPRRGFSWLAVNHLARNWCGKDVNIMDFWRGIIWTSPKDKNLSGEIMSWWDVWFFVLEAPVSNAFSSKWMITRRGEHIMTRAHTHMHNV